MKKYKTIQEKVDDVTELIKQKWAIEKRIEEVLEAGFETCVCLKEPCVCGGNPSSANL